MESLVRDITDSGDAAQAQPWFVLLLPSFSSSSSPDYVCSSECNDWNGPRAFFSYPFLFLLIIALLFFSVLHLLLCSIFFLLLLPFAHLIARCHRYCPPFSSSHLFLLLTFVTYFTCYVLRNPNPNFVRLHIEHLDRLLSHQLSERLEDTIAYFQSPELNQQLVLTLLDAFWERLLPELAGAPSTLPAKAR